MLAFGLRVVQGMLALGIFALLAREAVTLAPRGESASVATAPPVVAEVASALDDLPRYAVIGDRDLFHVKVEKIEAPPPAVIEETALAIELLGTLVRGSAEASVRTRPAVPQGASALPSRTVQPRPESLAILRDVDGKVRALAKGDTFADAHAKLVEIERGRIVLDHEGRLETVTLDETAVAAQTGAPRGTYAPPADPAAKAAAATDAEVARLQREVQRRMREAMPQVGAAQPTTGRN